MRNIIFLFIIIALPILSSCGVSDADLDRVSKSSWGPHGFVVEKEDILFPRYEFTGAEVEVLENIRYEDGSFVPLSDINHPDHEIFYPLKEKLGYKFYEPYSSRVKFKNFSFNTKEFLKNNPDEALWVGDGGGDGLRIATVLTNRAYIER